MSKLSIVGNNLLLFQNFHKTNSKFTQKSISEYFTQLFQYHKMSISHNPYNNHKMFISTHNPKYHNYSKTWFQFQSKFQLTNTKNHNTRKPMLTNQKPIPNCQTIQKFTINLSQTLQLESQLPTVTKNLSPGRIVLSASLPTLSGAWWHSIGHCWSLLHLQQQVVNLGRYPSYAFRRT